MDEGAYERWTQFRPFTMFQNLNQSPQDFERILYAIEKRKEDLPKTDYEALKSVSSNRRSFRGKIRHMMTREKKKVDEIMDHRGVGTEYATKAQYINFLEKLESDAVNSNPVNYPYIEYLFQKGIIDSSIHSKWIPVDKITRKDFLESLGTREDFTKILLAKFKKDLLNQIENPQEMKNQITNIEKKASQLLAKSYLEKIDNKAKSFYLTKDAFLKANSMIFDKALNAYKLEAVKEMILKPDPQELAKAYVEACAPEKVTTKHEGFKFPYQHFIDEFLSQIKIPQSIDPVSRGGIFNELENFDPRLSEIYRRPLVDGDMRLKDTPFEGLTADSRINLNNAAKMIYENWDTLNKALEERDQIPKIIKQMEDGFHEEIPRMIEIMKLIESNSRSPSPPIHPDETPKHIKMQRVNEEYQSRIKAKALPEQAKKVAEDDPAIQGKISETEDGSTKHSENNS
ncbi:hypothetical protein PGT21_031892 [Puccinia graminis f. sp. tritici]|nr:hypothetical protein PGT21_031892 [Puccinia graminis f. sp. tritici]